MSDLVLLGLSGSLRQGATNRKLLHEAARLFGPATFVEADLRFPLYDGDDEVARGIPAMVQTLADQIAAADAVVVSTPEYNAMLSGVLKNALDWISRTEGNPWLDKPVAVMAAAAGRSGGVLALSSLRASIRAFQPRVLQGPDVAVAASGQQFDDDGRLISAQYTKSLSTLMEKLRVDVAR
ncbi:MAG: NAD(P)H-dependent oxidoreductase [Rhodobacteraceae bacterium]|nr:NAD(P)H-dependent oxidoreductase [Paracoccaceae bacterium]